MNDNAPARTYYVVRNEKMGRLAFEREFLTYAEARATEEADAKMYSGLAPFWIVRCDVYESTVIQEPKEPTDGN